VTRGVGADDRLTAVLGALADPTRRRVVAALIEEGTVTVPSLTTRLPITRQAVAKHMAVLGAAGLVAGERGPGREVRYRLVPGALAPAAEWVRATADAWDGRLDRLGRRVEDG
jgi:DNA-binding transcriptional ArsR family regulator